MRNRTTSREATQNPLQMRARWLIVGCFAGMLAGALSATSHAELVAHWPLREAAGTDFVDLVDGNHGFVPEGATVGFASDAPAGVANGSVVFSGDSGASAIETPFFGVGGVEARTMMAWVKAQPQSRNTALVAYGALDPGRKWHFRIENDFIRTEFDSGQNFGSTTVADGQWHHVAVVFPDDGFEGDDLIHYIDGEAEEKAGGNSVDIDTATDPEEGAFPLHIGLAIGHAGRWFEGQMADVRVYDEALSSAELKSIMEGPSMSPPGAPGDFNLDGEVNMADFTALAENFNSTSSLLDSYSKGDFDLNARVDMSDFFAFRNALNAGQAPVAAAVPEPETCWSIAVGVLLSLSIRRQRRAIRR